MPARQRGRPKAEDAPTTPEEILDAAFRAFARLGFEGVSVRTLSRELGVSHNVIPQRFGTKQDLWRACVDRAFGGLVRDLAAAFDATLTDPLDQLRLGIRQFLLYSARNPDMLNLVHAEASTGSGRLDYLYESYIAPATAPLGWLLEELHAHGRIRKVELSTLHFLITSGGAAPFSLVALRQRMDAAGAGQWDEARARAHADLVADIITAGLATPR